MGSTPKTLMRLMTLTVQGHLPPGSSICDIGATQLFGDKDQSAARAFLDFYVERYPQAKRPADVPDQLAAIASDGFLGDLLLLAGFKYVALDIFHATNTILFDLNIHEPGPELAGRFDLVMNLGTTEHVLNQLRSFQTLHALMKVGGRTYHDLPMAGYANHAFFRYDPLFFASLTAPNRYEVILHEITVGTDKPVQESLRAIGYSVPSVKDVGIEMIWRRTTADPFVVPMETSTSLSVDENLSGVDQSAKVRIAAGTTVHYGTITSVDTLNFTALSRYWLGRAVRGVGRRLGRNS